MRQRDLVTPQGQDLRLIRTLDFSDVPYLTTREELAAIHE